MYLPIFQVLMNRLSIFSLPNFTPFATELFTRKIILGTAKKTRWAHKPTARAEAEFLCTRQSSDILPRCIHKTSTWSYNFTPSFIEQIICYENTSFNFSPFSEFFCGRLSAEKTLNNEWNIVTILRRRPVNSILKGRDIWNTRLSLYM